MLSIVSVLAIIITSVVIGWFARKWLNDSSAKEKALELELNKTKKELSNYQTEVNNYFEQTGLLFNNVSKQYKNLYDHLLSGSQTLCKSDKLAPQLENKIHDQEQWQKIKINTDSNNNKNFPDHNWHPTFFEARDAKATENIRDIKDLENIATINNHKKDIKNNTQNNIKKTAEELNTAEN